MVYIETYRGYIGFRATIMGIIYRYIYIYMYAVMIWFPQHSNLT